MAAGDGRMAHRPSRCRGISHKAGDFDRAVAVYEPAPLTTVGMRCARAGCSVSASEEKEYKPAEMECRCRPPAKVTGFGKTV